jgi:hypothetical protein
VPAAADELTRASELKIMEAVFATRAPGDWGALDVVQVSRLASAMAGLLGYEARLQAEGPLVRTAKGAKRNPLLDAIATRHALVVSGLRQLGLAVPAVDRRQLKAAAAPLAPHRRPWDAEDDPDDLFAKPWAS